MSDKESIPQFQPIQFEAVFRDREVVIEGPSEASVEAVNLYLHEMDIHPVSFLLPYNLVRPLRAHKLSVIRDPDNSEIRAELDHIYAHIHKVKTTIDTERLGGPFKLTGFGINKVLGAPELDPKNYVVWHDYPELVQPKPSEISNVPLSRGEITSLLSRERTDKVKKDIGSLAIIMTVKDTSSSMRLRTPGEFYIATSSPKRSGNR